MKTILYLPDGNRRFAKKEGISFDEAYYLGGKSGIKFRFKINWFFFI